MADSNTSLETQSSTVTFKKGHVVDFRRLTKAIESAGFKAGEIKVWTRGIVEQANGKLSLKVSGSNQSFPLRENGQTTKLKANLGKEVRVVGMLELDKGPPSLILEIFEM